MSTPGQRASALPEYLDQMVRGFMPSRCLLTALELDVFTAIANGSTAAEVADKIGANPRATEMLLNALAALGLVSKSGAVYTNSTDTARFFVEGSAENQRDGLLHTANIWHSWSTLTEAVQSGSRLPGDRAGAWNWTRNFIAAMDRNAAQRTEAVVKALGTAGVHRVLDLGGGSGAYSVAFAKASPEVRCEVLDLSEVVPLTTDYVRRAEVAGRVSVRGGDMLKSEYGSGYDLIMLNAICHMFSEEQNRELFRRARQALAPKGRLAMQDFILNADKAGPPQAALFALNMLVGTESGATYSEPEYSSWMKEAGFDSVQRIPLPGPSDLMVGSVA